MPSPATAIMKKYRISRKKPIINLLDIILEDFDESVSGIVELERQSVFTRLEWHKKKW